MLLMLILALILFNKHPSDEEARLKQKHDTIASLFNDLNLGHPLLTARVAVAFDPSAILHQRSIESLLFCQVRGLGILDLLGVRNVLLKLGELQLVCNLGGSLGIESLLKPPRDLP